MKNVVKTVSKAVVSRVNGMDMADLGKMAAGILMIAGGVVVLACGNANFDQINEVIDNEFGDTIKVNPVDAADVVVETVETVVKTVE